MNYNDILDDEGEVFILGQWFKADDFQEVQSTPKEEVETNTYGTDELLDQYIDYMTLHKMFGDIEYKEAAESVIRQLRSKLV